MESFCISQSTSWEVGVFVTMRAVSHTKPSSFVNMKKLQKTSYAWPNFTSLSRALQRLIKNGPLSWVMQLGCVCVNCCHDVLLFVFLMGGFHAMLSKLPEIAGNLGGHWDLVAWCLIYRVSARSLRKALTAWLVLSKHVRRSFGVLQFCQGHV